MKISIITINFNNLEGLKKTVNSVISQTYNNIEYLIIDGASTDGSAEYIKEQKSNFNYWVSEPDKGIYNAMNKGTDHTTGDYLLFLNSGDYLVDENVIEKFVGFDPAEDIVYGDVNRLPENEIYDGEFSLKKLFYKNISHQSIFYKNDIFKRFGKYIERYKIRADYALNINIFKTGNSMYVNLLVANVDTDGVSSQCFDYEFWDDYMDNYITPFSGIIKRGELYSILWKYYYRILLDKRDVLKSLKLFFEISFNELNMKSSLKAIRPLISVIFLR